MLSCFLDDFCVSEVKKVWRWNFGSFWEVSGNGKTDLGGFRQRKNGQKRKDNCKYRCFQRIWDVRLLKTQQKPVFWTNFILKNAYSKLCCFWRKDWNNTARTCAQTCINYVGFEGKQSKNAAKNIFWSACSIFLQGLNQKTCGVGGPPREAGWITTISKVFPSSQPKTCGKRLLAWRCSIVSAGAREYPVSIWRQPEGPWFPPCFRCVFFFCIFQDHSLEIKSSKVWKKMLQIPSSIFKLRPCTNCICRIITVCLCHLYIYIYIHTYIYTVYIYIYLNPIK